MSAARSKFQGQLRRCTKLMHTSTSEDLCGDPPKMTKAEYKEHRRKFRTLLVHILGNERSDRVDLRNGAGIRARRSRATSDLRRFLRVSSRMPFSSRAFIRSAGATPSREHMSAKALSTRASDSKPAPSAFTILNESSDQLTDHVFPADLFLRKKQIELGALVNVILGDELEVGCYGHYFLVLVQVDSGYMQERQPAQPDTQH